MKRFAKVFILFIILGFLPLLLPFNYVGLLVRVLILAIFAMSLDILMGYTGLASLGHGAYFGMAAYTVALLNRLVFHGTSNYFILEFSLAIIIAAFTAAVFGLFVIRTKGVYFMMVTIAIAEMLYGLALKWQTFTGGADGLAGISGGPEFFSTLSSNLPRDLYFFYFVWVVFVLSTIIMYLIVNSPFGHALVGIRENETKMDVLGFNIWLYKYIAFVIAGTFAGVAGILDVYYYRFVSPEVLGVANSIVPLMAVILGGTGTLFGALIGSGIYTSFEHILSGYMERWMMVIGMLFILLVIFAPRGLSPLTLKVWFLIKKQKRMGPPI